MVEQVIDRVLERPGEQLPREVDGQESRIRVDVLVARHGVGAEGTQPATSDLSGTRDCHLSSYIAHFSEAFPTASLGD